MNIEKRNMKHQTSSRKRENGIALLVAMFSLLILSLIGLALMTTSSTEVLINQNYRNSRAAYFAAEAGTEEARYRVGGGAGGNAIVPPANTTTAIYIRANTSINPTTGSASTNSYYDPEYFNVTKRDSSGNVTTLSSGLTTAQFVTTIQGASNQVPYAWVKITRKTENLAGQTIDAVSGNNSTAVYYGANTVTGVRSQYVRDATNSLTHDGNPVYLLTALSIDTSGSQRKIQTEVATPPPVTTTAAIESMEDVDFSGNLDISGIDECNPTQGVYGVKSEGAIDNTNPSQTILGEPAPTCEGCSFDHDLDSLINSLKSSSSFLPINSPGTNVDCSGSPVSCSGSNVNLGDVSTGTMKYYYSPGNLTITSNNSEGYGILIVDGDVTMHGGVSYEGLIIARGTFNFTGGGGNDINIRGAVIAGDSVNDTTSDLGGSIEVQYNSCSIANVFNNMPMTLLTFKDRAIY